MNNPLQEMTQDLQNRIRDLAYRMWETAGRQQGMAMEYWLKAERSVLATFAAAASMMPGSKPAAEASPEPQAPESTASASSTPATTAPASSTPSAPAETAAPPPPPPAPPAAAAAPAAATKQAGRRTSSRKAKA